MQNQSYEYRIRWKSEKRWRYEKRESELGCKTLLDYLLGQEDDPPCQCGETFTCGWCSGERKPAKEISVQRRPVGKWEPHSMTI